MRLFCAATAAKTRPADIAQAFTTAPVRPSPVWPIGKAA
jgi:hypothetical protein